MKSFFRALSQRRVRFLLISGQAAVLYGASTFSEDVDIWVDPTPANWRRLVEALEFANASVYKLTPPLQPALARRGHRFHFTIPPDDPADSVGYLDVMGKPPRVASFRACADRARTIPTGWGSLPVLSPVDLVRIKLTRRLGDYAVISALVRIVSAEDSRSRETWAWAVEHTFDAEEILALWRGARASWRTGLRSQRAAVLFLRTVKSAPDQKCMADLSALLGREMEGCRTADRRYWEPIIAELREMRRKRDLLPEGTIVSARNAARELS